MTVSQEMNCKLAMLTNFVKDLLLKFDPNADEVIGDSSIFFTNLDSFACPLQSCELKDQGCSGSYSGRLVMQETVPFEI